MSGAHQSHSDQEIQPFKLMKNTLRILTLILGLAGAMASAAEGPSRSPSTWWVAGPYPIYDQAMFEANEPIEDAKDW